MTGSTYQDLSQADVCPGDGYYQTDPHVAGVGIVCRRCNPDARPNIHRDQP
jgi:hypothetical protein